MGGGVILSETISKRDVDSKELHITIRTHDSKEQECCPVSRIILSFSGFNAVIDQRAQILIFLLKPISAWSICPSHSKSHNWQQEHTEWHQNEHLTHISTRNCWIIQIGIFRTTKGDCNPQYLCDTDLTTMCYNEQSSVVLQWGRKSNDLTKKRKSYHPRHALNRRRLLVHVELVGHIVGQARLILELWAQPCSRQPLASRLAVRTTIGARVGHHVHLKGGGRGSGLGLGT